MKRTIQMQVVNIENEGGETPRVVLQCPAGETIAPKDIVKAKAIFPEQEPLIVAMDRIKILGKGRPHINLGDTVEVQVISEGP